MYFRTLPILSIIMAIQCRILDKPDPVFNFKLSNLSPVKIKESFAKNIQISFVARAQEWKEELTLWEDIIHPNATLEIYGPDGELHVEKIENRVYRSKPGVIPSVIATVHDRDLITAKIITETSIFNMIPVEEFPDQSMVSTIDKNKMVFYEVQGTHHTRQRSLLAAYTKFTTVQDKKETCYTGQTTSRTMPMGIAVDVGYYEKIGGTVDKLKKAVSDLFVKANAVYQAQMGISFSFQLSSIVQFPTMTTSRPWNQKPTLTRKINGKDYKLCPNTANNNNPMTSTQQIVAFRTWTMANKPKTAAFWHLLTNCQVNLPPTYTYSTYGKPPCKTFSVAMTSITDPNGKVETWESFSASIGGVLGAEFANGGGLMASAINGNGYFPQLADEKNKPSTYNGIEQFNPANKLAFCKTLASLVSNAAAIPANQPCLTVTQSAYKWVTTKCSDKPVDCTCYCNSIGKGQWTSKMRCVNAQGQDDSADKCPLPKPPGVLESCNYATYNNGKSCPAVGTGKCVGGKANNIKEIGEECDRGLVNSPCCSSCQRVTSDACKKLDATRDAAFNNKLNKTQKFIFQAGAWAIYTDINAQTINEKFGGKPFPLPIKSYWKNLNSIFNTGIDAVIQADDGILYFFKDSQVSKYSLTLGELNGYPKLIQNSEFSTMYFGSAVNKQIPSSSAPLDAAISLPGGAYFFRGIEFVKFAFGQNTQDSSYPRSISDFDLPTQYFSGGISAAIHYLDEQAVDFFSASGYRQRWKFGTGVKTFNPLKLAALGVTSQTEANTLNCPQNCVNCIQSQICTICAVGYQAVSGQCYARSFMVEIKFEKDTYTEDMKYIESTSFQKSDFGAIAGIKGKAINFNAAGTSFIKLKAPSDKLKNWEILFWISCSKVKATSILTATAHVGSTPTTISINTVTVNSDTYTFSLMYGSSSLTSVKQIKVNTFVYISLVLRDDVVTFSVNGAQRKISLIPTKEPFLFKSITIGSPTVSTWSGVLDQFNIDNLDLAATAKFKVSGVSRLRTTFSWFIVLFTIFFPRYF